MKIFMLNDPHATEDMCRKNNKKMETPHLYLQNQRNLSKTTIPVSAIQ